MSATISVLCLACGSAVGRKLSELRRNPNVYCNKTCRGLVSTRQASARLWINTKATNARCIEWLGPFNEDGYGTACLKGARRSAHVIAWTLVNGAPASGMHVCHRCDNRRCINPKHLFLGTAMDNWDDMRAKGRHRGGPNHRRPLPVPPDNQARGEGGG